MAMLNTSKLQGKPQGVWTRGVPTKRGRKGDEYQCPVCAEAGMDSKGVHLLIYSGKANYACVAYPRDARHRQLIFDRVGIRSNGRSDPIIPRKIEQTNTFIGREVARLALESDKILEQEAAIRREWQEKMRLKQEEERLNRERHERWKQEDRERAERLKKILSSQTQHIDTNSNTVQVGTFGTVILSSSNMPPPPIINNTTLYKQGGYAQTTMKKLSQTSQISLAYRERGERPAGSNEFDCPDLKVIFNENHPQYRDQYYNLWREKYYATQ
jgi:hypothetical protein